jgi:hypothetical protein
MARPPRQQDVEPGHDGVLCLPRRPEALRPPGRATSGGPRVIDLAALDWEDLRAFAAIARSACSGCPPTPRGPARP